MPASPKSGLRNFEARSVSKMTTGLVLPIRLCSPIAMLAAVNVLPDPSTPSMAALKNGFSVADWGEE
jgi:hypothetical protein